jgi:hypothetical protein
MIIGIVGAEASKFTEYGRIQALAAIMELVTKADGIVSGECHLGGIDIWAKEAALKAGKPFFSFPPTNLRWAPAGFKARNIQIARKSDEVVCIAVNQYPHEFSDYRTDHCYHCVQPMLPVQLPHVKSGGCWTRWYANSLDKPNSLIVVSNFGE